MDKQYVVVYPKQKTIMVTSNGVTLEVSKKLIPVMLEKKGDEAIVALKREDHDGHVKAIAKIYGQVLMIGDFVNAGTFRIVKLIYKLVKGELGEEPFIIDPDNSSLVERRK